MTILKCDKCGAETKREDAFVIQIADYMYRRTTEGQQFELCDKCLLDFVRWWNESADNNGGRRICQINKG